ncbi:hypothetical protein ACF0H5_012918 [Mactra antiquata]
MNSRCWSPSTVTVVVILSGFLQGCQCHTLNESKQLLTDLLDGYNKNLRPVKNQFMPVVLVVGFELISILDVDEVSQTITIMGTFEFHWADESIKWQPLAYGGLLSFTSSNEQFWTPPIVLTTSSGALKKLGEPWQPIRYDFDGISHFYPSDVFSSVCTMDITNFPYDQHECLLEFVALGYTPEELYMVNSSNKVFLSTYTKNGAWDLIGSEIHVTRIAEFTSTYDVKLIIKRISRFAIMNIFIPLIFLSLLNLVVFFIPVESGERISFCITLLLAIAVLMTIVGDNLPKTSYPMSVFSYYLCGVLTMSNCITLATIFNLSMYYQDESKSVPYLWRMAVKIMRYECLGRRKQETTCGIKSSIIDENTVHPISVVTETDLTNGDTEKRRNSGSGDLKPDIEYIQTENKPDISWKDVSSAFDRVAFSFFFSAFVIGTAVLFGIIIQ